MKNTYKKRISSTAGEFFVGQDMKHAYNYSDIRQRSLVVAKRGEEFGWGGGRCEDEIHTTYFEERIPRSLLRR